MNYRIKIECSELELAQAYNKLKSMNLISISPVRPTGGGKTKPIVQRYLNKTGESHLRRSRQELASGLSLAQAAHHRLRRFSALAYTD